MTFELRDLALAGALALLGFIITLKPILLFIAKLNPFYGLMLYYAIFGITIFIFSKIGLTVFKAIKNIPQIIGLLLIFFAFNIVFNLTSGYVQYIVAGNILANPIMIQSEDGFVFWAWSLIIPLQGWWIQVVRVLTFVVSPFLIALVGGALIKGRVNLSGGL